ncbi:MAG: TasA family protein [Sarcina sp.]
MKKLAIIAALTLAIGASVTAGTMAKYSQTLDEQTSTVQAKTFGIDATYNPMVENIKPGDSYKFEFKVSNTGEVDAETEIRVNLGDSELLKVIDSGWNTDAGIELIDSEGKMAICDRQDDYGNYYWKVDMKGQSEATYTVDIPWVSEVGKYSPIYKTQAELEEANTSVQGQSGEIEVQITGTQK